MTSALKQKAEELKTWLALAHKQYLEEQEKKREMGYTLEDLPEDDSELNFNDWD